MTTTVSWSGFHCDTKIGASTIKLPVELSYRILRVPRQGPIFGVPRLLSPNRFILHTIAIDCQSRRHSGYAHFLKAFELSQAMPFRITRSISLIAVVDSSAEASIVLSAGITLSFGPAFRLERNEDKRSRAFRYFDLVTPATTKWIYS
jgi:hypothetical protein